MQLMAFHGAKSGLYCCQHPSNPACRHTFERIAQELTLDDMRNTARVWLEENKQ